MYRFLLLTFIILLGLSGRICAQGNVTNMVNGQTIYINACSQTNGFIYDDGGPTEKYSDNFSGAVVIKANAPITLSGTVHTESCCDHVTILDEDGNIFSTFRGSVTIAGQTFPTKTIRIEFYSDGSYTYDGFAIEYQTTNPNPDCHFNAIDSIWTTDIGSTDAMVHWSAPDTTQTFIISHGRVRDTVSNTTCFHLDSLELGSTTLVTVTDLRNDSSQCCQMSHQLTNFCPRTPCYLNFTDIRSCKVTCTSGFFDSPFRHVGVIDYGPLDVRSRHTVITDTTAYDVNTLYGLKKVPPGGTASVRLGNNLTGAQAESITYEYTVDTTCHDMLVLKYAAVLQDPDHILSEQPKFTFKIVDSTGADLDENCTSAIFISGPDMGWNTCSNGNHWKDWTTVGVDLVPLHGQTIYIQLTTYDCSQGAHYGYAYFTLEQGTKNIQTEGCGEFDGNTFVAPEGFSYRWFMADDPTETLGTGRTLSVTLPGTYNCELGFVGGTSNSCSFYLSAITQSRYPAASATYTLDTTGCQYRIDFNNTSRIATDSNRLQLTANECDGYFWDFGDGTTSLEKNPSHVYDTGSYRAMLIASLSHGQCQDTAWFDFVVEHKVFHTYDTICESSSLPFGDSIYADPGIYVYDPRPHAICDSAIVLHLSTSPEYEYTTFDSICRRQEYRWIDGNIYTENTDTPVDSMLTQFGCDSIAHLNLFVDTSMVARMTVSPTTITLSNDHVVMYDGSYNAKERLWEYGASTSTDQKVEFDYYNICGFDSLDVTLYVTSRYGCTDTLSTTIRPIASAIWAPNVFTPRAETNNHWFITGYNIEYLSVYIYNRDGELICHYTGLDGYWDGRNPDGRHTTQDAYPYRAFYRTKDNPEKTQSLTGTITVLE